MGNIFILTFSMYYILQITFPQVIRMVRLLIGGCNNEGLACYIKTLKILISMNGIAWEALLNHENQEVRMLCN